ncbi:XRE family transcriptional regulator [Sphingomonas gilva]|uniref:XRE family transcriptional regulator n=1 Tax=Sphingomonas gilva TaxID=2305907 RepID=A0A396RLH2_9SPHN|nr:helix-turn-helix transcriptional regulator [Sphingomonas gilva]RHW17160.1 XRE family transcriptional regulator [Sphingomonas gilva]
MTGVRAEMFGERIRTRAAELGWGLSDLSRESGTKKATLQNFWEGRLCRADVLFPLADALGVSPRWLATGEGEVAPAVWRQY